MIQMYGCTLTLCHVVASHRVLWFCLTGHAPFLDLDNYYWEKGRINDCFLFYFAVQNCCQVKDESELKVLPALEPRGEEKFGEKNNKGKFGIFVYCVSVVSLSKAADRPTVKCCNLGR